MATMDVFLSSVNNAVKSITHSIYSMEQSVTLRPHNEAVYLTAVREAILADKACLEDNNATWKRMSGEKWDKAKKFLKNCIKVPKIQESLGQWLYFQQHYCKLHSMF